MLPLLIIAIETGMRRSELLALTWTDIDLSARVAHVRVSKNGDTRDVPLTRRAVRTLEGVQVSAGGDTVFPFAANAVRLAFERIRARAGCLDLRFHDLRREAITRFIERGLNIIEAS
jgi:integrase